MELPLFLMVLLGVLGVYVLVCAVMYLLQRSLLYFPARGIASPTAYGFHGFVDHRFISDDGVGVHGWFYAPPAGAPTILYFHGNAGNLRDRAEMLRALAEYGFGVFCLSYRGYGNSEGKPHERGLYADARAALAHLSSLGISHERVILLGESLGTGVATKIACETKVAAVVLQSPYTSVAARAAQIYWYVPVRLLIKDRFDSLGRIRNIQSPLFVYHGKKDTVIPVAQGMALFNAAPEPKEAIFFEEFGHSDFTTRMIAGRITAFAKRHNLFGS